MLTRVREYGSVVSCVCTKSNSTEKWQMGTMWHKTQNTQIGTMWHKTQNDKNLFGGTLFLQPMRQQVYFIESNPRCKALLSLSIYTRQTQQSAQLFSPCVFWWIWYMTPLVGNQSIIINAHHFYSRLVTIIFDNFVQQLMFLTIYLANHSELLLLIRDGTNTSLKRSVGSWWWLVHPHGRYHHGSDHRMQEGAQWMVGLCWVRWQIKIKIMNALISSFYN